MSTTSVGQIALDLVVNQNQFNKQMTGIQSLAKKTGTMLVAAFGVKQLVNYSKQCMELASDLQEVQNVANVAFPNMTAQMDNFAKSAAANFGLSETMAKKYSSLYGTMAKQFGFTEQSAYDMGTTLAGLAGDVASFYNMSQDEAYTKLKSVFSGETETLKEIGVVMTQSALDAYALANGFGKTTSAMSENEKVALRYAYVQEQLSAATGDFLRTSDSWANQTRLLKLNLEQLGSTIGGTLINAFKPLVSTLNIAIGKFTDFAQAISDSLGKIFGWTYEDGGGITSDLESSAGSANNIASGIGNAVSNAKKLKQQLGGIDELNVLTTDTTNSESTSGSVGGSSASNIGEWKQAESIIDGFQGKLGTLEKLFQDIKIGDWFSVGEDTSKLVSGILDFFSDAIADVEWEKLGDDTGEFISGIDWYDVITSAIALSWNTGIGLTEFFIGLFNGLDEERFADGIIKGIKETDWKKVIKSFFGGVFKLGDLLDALDLGALFPQLATRIKGMNLAIDIWEFLFNFDWKSLKEKTETKWNEITNWWENRPKLKEIEFDFSDLLGSIKNLWEDVTSWWKLKPKLTDIDAKVNDLKSKIQIKWNEARAWWQVRPVLSMISPNIVNIKDNLKTAWETAKKWWTNNVKLSIPKLDFKVTYKKASGAIQKAVVSALSLDGWPSLQFFAQGGFPEDGWFRAKHGEIMGKFDNGKSVVANNNQITEGISSAVYRGNQESNTLMRKEIELLQKQNELLLGILEKESGITQGEIGRAVRRENQEYFQRTGKGLLEV